MADEVRLIDAKLLTTNIAQIAKNCARSDAQKALIGRILFMIENMPTIEAEPVNGWISVDERLPEDDGKYMVWYKGELDICEFDTDSQTFGYTYDDYDDMYSRLVCWDDGMDKDVTHWKPLPEPPKEVENETD